ncbi:MAG: DUF3536 domain-containing protein [Deltaproteobacteria bacterium]|nr:DUF3536 domain-containing protein [Deltaproteobacteria bacterium]
MTPSRYLIIHGHFYQPPRENPFSGSIADQPSAAPYPNWNKRICQECYSPNALARLLDDKGEITRVVNNYQHISFNIGPTLMSWLAEEEPETWALAVEADRLGALAHDGHGPALAQVFNHVVMPLANFRDKQTQIVWGREFFKKTFARDPEGMWLAETAADSVSLSLLAKAGLKFTVLAQNQIDAVRPLTADRSEPWEPVGQPDPREPYRIFWGDGQDDYLDVFVYDGPVSRAVAFESLLRDGENFLNRTRQAFGAPFPDGRPRLVNLATDGESYGHHFQFGEMALAYLIDKIETTRDDSADPTVLTNYGHFLSLFPPRMEARLVENSSWSCVHGVERWRSDCGCRTGGEAHWNQKWRGPLRDGLNWLRDELSSLFERSLAELLNDPWLARDDYVRVVMSDYDPGEQESFLQKHSRRPLAAAERRTALRQMEIQLMSLYMFTSCGWFFDELTGLEPVQNLRYASRAIALSDDSSRERLKNGLLAHLRLAKPNDRDYLDGEDVWNKLVEPASLSKAAFAAHWSAASLMGVTEALDGFKRQKRRELETKKAAIGAHGVFLGQVGVTDPREGGETIFLSLAASRDGGENLRIWAVEPGAEGRRPNLSEMLNAIEGDPAAILDPSKNSPIISSWFGPSPAEFSLEDLWPSVRQAILDDLVEDFFTDLRSHTEKAFHSSSNMLLKYGRSRSRLDWQSSFVFRVVLEAKMGSCIETMKKGGELNLADLAALLSQFDPADSVRSAAALSQSAQKYLAALLNLADSAQFRPSIFREAADFIDFAKQNRLACNYWDCQNRWLRLSKKPNYLNSLASAQLSEFRHLGHILGFDPSKFVQA